MWVLATSWKASCGSSKKFSKIIVRIGVSKFYCKNCGGCVQHLVLYRTGRTTRPPLPGCSRSRIPDLYNYNSLLLLLLFGLHYKLLYKANYFGAVAFKNYRLIHNIFKVLLN